MRMVVESIGHTQSPCIPPKTSSTSKMFPRRLLFLSRSVGVQPRQLFLARFSSNATLLERVALAQSRPSVASKIPAFTRLSSDYAAERSERSYRPRQRAPRSFNNSPEAHEPAKTATEKIYIGNLSDLTRQEVEEVVQDLPGLTNMSKRMLYYLNLLSGCDGGISNHNLL